MLDRYNLSFLELEFELYCLVKEFEAANVAIAPFTFNRFEEGQEKDCRKALENAITVLKDLKTELM
ncbi:TPA_asm: hypothetical protein GIN74_08225 [Listeria monocytogenes]|nr:hypothetical protein [Listeria monocytogenes]